MASASEPRLVELLCQTLPVVRLPRQGAMRAEAQPKPSMARAHIPGVGGTGGKSVLPATTNTNPARHNHHFHPGLGAIPGGHQPGAYKKYNHAN